MRPSLPSSSFHSISLVFSLKRYMAIPQITIYLSFLHFPPVPAALFLLFTLLLLAWALCTLLFFIHHMVDFWIGRYSHVTSTWDFVSLQQRGRLCNWTSLPSQSPLAFTYRVVYCLFFSCPFFLNFKGNCLEISQLLHFTAAQVSCVWSVLCKGDKHKGEVNRRMGGEELAVHITNSSQERAVSSD